MSEIIYLANVRLSFPHLVEARAATDNPGAVKKYSADFIMAPDRTGFQQFYQCYSELALEKWGEHAPAVMQLIQNDRKTRCYGNGNEKVNRKTFQPYDGYKDMVFISANNANPPQMIQADGKPVDAGNTMAYQALARKMYGGCYVNAAIKPWPQDNMHGRGIRCDLVAIQFAADGEAFGEGAVDVTPIFGAVAVAGPAAAPAGIMGLPPFMQS